MTPACPTDEDLASFLGGRLPAEKSREIASHLAGCQDCRNWLAGMRTQEADRDRAGKRLRVWVWATSLLGVILIALLVLVAISGQKIEKLAGERGLAAPRQGALFRFLPERQVSPGKVFPIYRLREPVTYERLDVRSPQFRIYSLEAGSGLQRIEIESGSELSAPSRRGLFSYVAIDFPAAATNDEIAEFEKSVGELARRSQPMVLLGSLHSALRQRGWPYQIFSLEWED